MTKPILKAARHVLAIYSDDVRTEVGNKLSLMGVYQGVMFVRDVPVTLPKLCITVMVRTPVTAPFKELLLEVLRNDELIITRPISVSPQPVKDLFPGAPDLEKYLGSTTVVQVAPFEIGGNFVLRTRVTTEAEVIRGGALMVVHQQTAAPQDAPIKT